MARIKSMVLLPATTTTATGPAQNPHSRPMVFTIEGETSAGTGSVTATIEALIGTGTIFTVLDTLSLTLGTVTTVDFGSSDLAWENVRARVTAISGTGATVRAFLACESIY